MFLLIGEEGVEESGELAAGGNWLFHFLQIGVQFQSSRFRLEKTCATTTTTAAAVWLVVKFAAVAGSFEFVFVVDGANRFGAVKSGGGIEFGGGGEETGIGRAGA